MRTRRLRSPAARPTFSGEFRLRLPACSHYLTLCARSMNEPDLDTQSDMTVPQAVALWKSAMSPFYGKAKLVSPAVTNGGYPMGVGYLQDFKGNCTQCWNEIDAVALHCAFSRPSLPFRHTFYHAEALNSIGYDSAMSDAYFKVRFW